MCLRSICCCENLLHSAKAERSEAIEPQQRPSKRVDKFITRLPKMAEACSDTYTCVHVCVVFIHAYLCVCVHT